MASVTRWTIIILSFLFTVGLVIVICENMVSVLNWEDGDAARQATRLALFPLVAAMLQIPWLQDMHIISALGLVVYSVGVVGSTIYSAIITIRSGGNNEYGMAMPEDMWEIKWEGTTTFVGSAIYAMEGIMLALPTLHSMQHPEDAIPVVCGSLMLYGFVTLVFASVGYAGGLGGGPGTGHEPEECDLVTICIIPPLLKTVIQIALSISMLLSIPVMLYPTTEMLEVMLTDKKERKEEGQNKTPFVPELPIVDYNRGSGLGKNQRQGGEISLGQDKPSHPDRTGNSDGGPYGNEYTCDPDTFKHNSYSTDEFSQEKNWKLRLFLAISVVYLGAATKSFTMYSSVIGDVGLTFAGFVLPSLIYVKATEQAGLTISRPFKGCLVLLVAFGIFNMVFGGIGALKDLIKAIFYPEQ